MRHGTLSALATTLAVCATSPVIGAQPYTPTETPPTPLGTAVSENTLALNRGGYALQINQNQLDARLYDNQAIGNITGTNSVSDSAFSGMSGFATIVQNSGNNVIVQNATILNVQLK